MMTRLFAPVSIALSLVFAAPAFAASTAFDEASRIVDAFHAALQKGDRDAALSQLDGAVAIYEQGWVEHSKAEYAASHLDSDLKFSMATTSKRTDRTGTLIGDLAYVTSEGTVSGTFEGKPVNSITLETMILRRTDDGWRIIHIHWSSRKPK
jgi:ketosteroid isomerase-like protein